MIFKVCSEDDDRMVIMPRGKKWPFFTLRVGEWVTVREGEYGISPPQVAAHAHARYFNKSFKTKSVGNGVWVVTRTA